MSTDPPGAAVSEGRARLDVVLRTALRPRWLALLVVVLVAAAAMARLGQWQLDRARQQGERDRQRQAAAQPVVPVESLLTPRTAFSVAALDRRVTATGRWDAARQLLAPGRTLDGVTGAWVLTPLVLPDGSAVAVLRGWAPGAAADTTGLPAGEVRVEGVLRPSEPVDDLPPGAVAALPEGQVPRASSALFAQHWPQPLVAGYLVQTASTPASAAALRPVPPDVRPPLALLNVSYALQWWLFSAFGLFFWYRLVRDDARGRLRPDPAAGGPEPVGDDEPAPPGETPRPTIDAGGRP